jgi:hypothetical protein
LSATLGACAATLSSLTGLLCAHVLATKQPQGNRTSKQGQERGKIGIVPSGPFELAAQRSL